MRLHFNHRWLNVQGTKRIDILLKNTPTSLSDGYSWACHLNKHLYILFVGLGAESYFENS